MWEQLTPADIQRVKHRLALERAAILSRHAAELKTLDTQQDELEKFERIVEAFAEKYLNTETSPSQPTTQSEEQSTEALAIKQEPAPAAPPDRERSEPPAPEPH